MSWEDKYDAMCDYNAEQQREGEDSGKAEVLDEVIIDFEEIREELVGIKIPYGVILKINSFKDKYQAWRNEL